MSAYAIGPGLHNWDYKECERRSISKILRAR